VTIGYAGVDVGLGTSYDIDGIHSLDEAYNQLSLEFSVVFRSDTVSGAQTLDAALRAAYTKPDQDLTITIGGITWLSLSHSLGTGFDSRSSMESLDRFRTQRSMGYRIRITVELPADLAGRDYRQSSSWAATVLPTGQTMLSVEAVYTVNGTTSAYAQATGGAFDTYVAAVQAIVGGTWVEAQGGRYEPNDQNTVCRASATYQQRLINDSAVGAADPDIEVRSYRVLVDRPETYQLLGAGSKPMVRVNVLFDVDVLKTADKRTVYETKVRPYLATLISTHSDVVGTPHVATERPDYDCWGSRLTGTVTYIVTESSLIRASKKVRGRESTGQTLVPLLDKTDPFSKVRFTGPQFRTRSVELITLELVGGNQHQKLVEAARKEAESAGYHHLDTQTAIEETELVGTTLRFVERGTVMTFEYGNLKGDPPRRRRVITQPGFTKQGG